MSYRACDFCGATTELGEKYASRKSERPQDQFYTACMSCALKVNEGAAHSIFGDGKTGRTFHADYWHHALARRGFACPQCGNIHTINQL